MDAIVVPLAAPPRGLAMDGEAHARLARIEAARDALRAARTPAPALGSAFAEPPPLPPSFEEALVARAAHAAANRPPPPPAPPPPQTVDPSVDLWGGETAQPRPAAPAADPLALAAPAPAAAPDGEWLPAEAAQAAPAGPVVVDARRLAADPRSIFPAEVIEALRARHLGHGVVPLRAEADPAAAPPLPIAPAAAAGREGLP